MRSTEAALAGAGAAILGWIVGLPLGLAIPAALVAGANGLISGLRGIYAWRTPSGWIGFVLDSTWGLVGTAASTLIHALQAAMPSGRYRADLSLRRGRHVYEGGYRIRSGFASAIGNVITNADGVSGLDGTGGPRRRLLVDRHEMLHVWQQRWFGPLFPILYAVWAVVAGLLGLMIGLSTRRSVFKSVFTLAYYDNPFEYWAYRRDRYWPPAGADPVLAWRGGVKESPTDDIV